MSMVVRPVPQAATGPLSCWGVGQEMTKQMGVQQISVRNGQNLSLTTPGPGTWNVTQNVMDQLGNSFCNGTVQVTGQFFNWTVPMPLIETVRANATANYTSTKFSAGGSIQWNVALANATGSHTHYLSDSYTIVNSTSDAGLSAPVGSAGKLGLMLGVMMCLGVLLPTAVLL